MEILDIPSIVNIVPISYKEKVLEPKKNLLLTSEKGLHKTNPSWQEVKIAIFSLVPESSNSYCILSIAGEENYIQALCCGKNEYRLEQRFAIKGFYVHSYALPNNMNIESAILEEKQGRQSNLPSLNMVVNSFYAWYYNKDAKEDVIWRKLEI